MATLLLPRFLLPVQPQGVVLENHALLISGEHIEAVLPAEEAIRLYPEAEQVKLSEHTLMPGLINMHTHSAMTLLRGYADDMNLQVWLNDHIWPAEKRWVSEEYVRDGVQLAVAEMLRGGTTCFNDNYFFPDVTAQTARDVGMRAMVGLPVIEVPTAWASDLDEYIHRGLEVHHDWIDDDLVRTTFAPHAPYTVSDAALEKISQISEEHQLPVHMHILETSWEIGHSIEQHGLRPLQRLQQLDLLNERLLAVHMTQLSDEDVQLLAESGVHVIHCPESNLKLASGFCPVAALQKAGVNVAVGTDGAASNNDLDMLGEARTAAMLAKCLASDPTAVSAEVALEMMTINGAKALGLDHELGSLEPGKQADLCAIDLSEPETQPLHHVVSQIIYAASRRQVSDVWVAGKRLLQDGELTTMDIEAVKHTAAGWREKMRAT